MLTLGIGGSVPEQTKSSGVGRWILIIVAIVAVVAAIVHFH